MIIYIFKFDHFLISEAKKTYKSNFKRYLSRILLKIFTSSAKNSTFNAIMIPSQFAVKQQTTSNVRWEQRLTPTCPRTGLGSRGGTYKSPEQSKPDTSDYKRMSSSDTRWDMSRSDTAEWVNQDFTVIMETWWEHWQKKGKTIHQPIKEAVYSSTVPF